MAFFGFVLTACLDLSIHQLDQENQNSLKNYSGDIDREGQIYTRELRKSYISVAKRAKCIFKLNNNNDFSSHLIGARSNLFLKKMSMNITFELNDVIQDKPFLPAPYLAMHARSSIFIIWSGQIRISCAGTACYFAGPACRASFAAVFFRTEAIISCVSRENCTPSNQRLFDKTTGKFFCISVSW